MFCEGIGIKQNRKVALVIAIAVIFLAAVILVYRLYHPEEAKFYSKQVSPGESYVAWDGNPPTPGYTFHAIRYNLYINGSVIYGSGTHATSWTCPLYVYGQEGNSSYKVDYAIVWTYAQG